MAVTREVVPEPFRSMEVTPAVALCLLREVLREERRELLGGLFLDARRRPISYHIVEGAHGDEKEPWRLFRVALVALAREVVLFQLRPSRAPTPLPEDLDVTQRFLETARLLPIRLLDHLIIGRRGSWVTIGGRGGLR